MNKQQSTHLPENAEDPLSQLDQELHRLITRLKDLEPGASEWRITMSRLLGKIQAQPEFRQYCRPGCPDYLLTALNKTWMWLSRGAIKNFRLPQHPIGTWEAMVRWLKAPGCYLWWRVKEEKQKYDAEQNRFSLDQPRGKSDESEAGTWLDEIYEQLQRLGDIPSLSGMEDFIRRQSEREQQVLEMRFVLYIQQDPDGKLQNCHPRGKEKCNAQIVAQRLLLKQPPDKRVVIADEFDVDHRTFYSFCTQRVIPLLKKIFDEL
jgi:hypothetical protein